MNIQEIETEIKTVEAEIAPLSANLVQLRRELSRLKSKEFIRVNEIKKEDVESPDGEDRPWFGDAYSFGKWMRKNSTRPWCSWNGILVRSSDLKNGDFRQTAGLVEDL